jgi:hypothetical protein
MTPSDSGRQICAEINFNGIFTVLERCCSGEDVD